MDATEHEPPIVKNGPKIPGYTILSRLGEGGMATVYLAIQESFGRKVAIKVMMPKAQDDPSYGERFLREARIVARLSHPCIVPVYDVGSSGDYYYISMEYLDDGNLADRIRKGLSLKEITRISREVAMALDFAHRKGIIHRDIKPDNIMFREDGAAVLTDFGIARPTEPDLNMTQAGKVIGTPKYMSPEQTKGETLDNTCDLYALGIMLHEMLTGNVPFDGANPFEIGIKHLKDPIPRLPSTLSMFQPLLDKLLVKNKAHRLQTGQEVITILDKIDEVLRLRDSLAKSARKPSPNDNTVIRETSVEKHPIAGDTLHADNRGNNQAARPVQRISTSLILLLLVLASLSVISVIWTAPRFAPHNDWLMSANQKLVKVVMPAPVVIEYVTPVATPAMTPAQASGDTLATPSTAAVYPAISDIQKYLNEAKVAVALGNYATPSGESALDHYRSVLAIDPDNIDAKLGIADIAAKLVDQTNEAIESDNLAKARELADKASSISENMPGLAATLALLATREQAEIDARRKAEQIARQQADTERKRQENATHRQVTASTPAITTAALKNSDEKPATNALMNKVRINGLLAKASTYFTRGDYYGPGTENALNKYQEALNLDPYNSQARQGIDKIASLMLKDINERLAANEPGSAQTIYRQAIKAAPDHSALQALGRSRGW